FGDVNVNSTEDTGFGQYSSGARGWDEIAFLSPKWLICRSAGNDRNDAHTGSHYHRAGNFWVLSTDSHPRDCNRGQGYDCVSYKGCAKNILTVGAVDDIVGGYAGPASVVMTSFTAWGPCDDGRIKPDIMANGESLLSSSATGNAHYLSLSGTSMSSPNTAGSLALLVQHHRNTHNGDDMRSATLKGIVIHTADEAGGAPGPDYSFGWGLLNSLSAADQISLDESVPTAVQELTLRPGERIRFAGTYTGSAAIKATICWTDPPGSPPSSSLLDPPTKMLVNDLDLRILASEGTVFEPWYLNGLSPASAARRRDNDTDNVEVVRVDAPAAGRYEVSITHKGVLENQRQDFSLIVSGLGELNAKGACCLGLICDELIEEDCSNVGGFYVGFDTTCPGNDCNGNQLPDECDIADGRSQDCDENGIPDECDPDGDGDTVPDECDVCSGADDRIDTDDDGTPDGCDPCPFDNPNDSDGDGVCDSTDLCPGFDDRLDADGDGVPDGCDACPGADDSLPGQQDDDDGDGVMNCIDKCPGVDDVVYAPECQKAIPALSVWGLIVLAVTLLVLAKIKFGRRRLDSNPRF
ncbi:MAG: S8 family serine peptidase, partial [Planctomycetes bacterium]|nr:S8 family serine peptidase [Planctomycetota bacterium]